MKNRFSIKWALSGEEDLLQIIEYIFEKSPMTARKVFHSIKEAAKGLSLFPERGRVIPELEAQGIFLFREHIISPWRIIYRVSKGTVFVLAVIDSRQNVEDVLIQRILRDKKQKED